MPQASKPKELERRFFQVTELRMNADDAGKKTMRGYAAVFDSLSPDLGGFKEKIAKGAFAGSVGSGDVRALFNHDPSQVLGRSKAGTLRMIEDDHGLAIEIDPPDTQLGRDLSVLMERGDITQMSFGFFVRNDAWAKVNGAWERTLLDVDLLDVSPVTYPAYPQTEIALRGLEQARAGDPDLVRRQEEKVKADAEHRSRTLALLK